MNLLAITLVAVGLALTYLGVRRPAVAGPGEAADDLAGSNLVDVRPFSERVLIPGIRRVAGDLGRLTPHAYRDRLQRKLVVAGLGDLIRPEELIAVQLIGVCAGTFVGSALAWWAGLGGRGFTLFIGLSAFAGLALPIARLNQRISKRQDQVRHELPDLVDNLRVAVQAGASVEGALDLILDQRNGPLSIEMGRMLSEIRLGRHRHDALVRLRARLDVPELGALVSALIQADELGMPLGQVLAAQAVELRLRARQWARERAGKLPVKITMPLVLFIFPPVLVITAGPAMSDILTAL